MNCVTNDEIKTFLNEVQPSCNGILGEIQKEAIEAGVPIIQTEVAKLLGVILQIKKPKNILEIGTAIGFSACFMSKYLQKDGRITTIERHDIMIEQAIKNINRMELESIIDLKQGEAAEILPNLNDKYDVIFMDAAKAQYNILLDEFIRLLPTGGILIADDVLQDGFIAKSRFEIPRRQRTIHKRMRNFLWNISRSDIFESTIIPIGDGVAICYKIA